MADLEMLDALRERGATRVTFHENGTLSSVEYGPLASADADDTQHESKSEPPKRKRSATGGLIPRAIDGS